MKEAFVSGGGNSVTLGDLRTAGFPHTRMLQKGLSKWKDSFAT